MKQSRMWRFLAALLALTMLASACGAAEEVVDTAKEAGETAAETAKDAGEAVAETAKDGADKAAEVVEETKDAVEEAVSGEDSEEAAEGAEEAAEEVEEASPAADGDHATGGTLVWVHEQEPPDLHVDDPNNNLGITGWVRAALIEGLYGVSAAGEFQPELLAEEAVMTENEDGTITIDYKLREGLQWSDGTPLTTADVVYTYDILMEGCDLEVLRDAESEEADGCVYLTGSREGIQEINEIVVHSDTEFTVEMEKFFGGWKYFFSEIYAAHAFGADATEVNDNLREWSNADGVLPSSGPMIYDGRDQGVSLSMVRNDNYHGSVSRDAVNTGPAYIDGVKMVFVADTDAQINALKAGEAHIVMTQPQLAFGERLSTDENFTVDSKAGPVFEHWGFNLLNAHLSDSNVREAMAYGMDKTEVMAGLYQPLFGDSLPLEGLGNIYFMSNSSRYDDHQAEYGGKQVDAAKAKLEESGYVLGSDGIYEHPERGRLTLRVGTTGGNKLRELQQQILQAQLAESGIEIVIDNVPGGAYFGEVPFSEAALTASKTSGAEGDPTVWDITQFAWIGGPWPAGISANFRSGSGGNPYAHNSPTFDAAADACDLIVDEEEAAPCFHDLNKMLVTLDGDPEYGLVIVPLTQKPSYYGYLSSQLSSAGVAPDAGGAGPLANVVDFAFK